VTPPTDSFQIREFRVADAAAVHTLAKSAVEAGQWSLESYERLHELGEMGWVVERDGSVRGFLVVRIIAPEMEILNLAVAAEARRNGLAAKLLVAAEKTALEKSVKRVFLEVRETNVVAIAFYERHGFGKMGSRAGYYRDPVESAVLMEKGIAE
jgi:ribosomal-protein-alanine N-acetyltransferase